MKSGVLCLAIAAALGGHPVAAGGRQTFAKSWEGRRVVVRQTLYSLVYNERGTLGTTRSGKREGLVVVTPSRGVYFQFDGRQGRDDVVARDVQRIIGAVHTAYEADSQDVRAYRKIEPLAINRYEPGVPLVVRRVTFDRDEVVLALSAADGGRGEEPVTSMRIKWPLPLSESFEERDTIEALILQFLALVPA